MINPPSAKIPLSDKQRKHIASIKAEDFFQFAPEDACFACGCSEFKTLAEYDRYGFPLDYVSCVSCGFLFANPYYTEGCLAEFYSKHYAQIYGRAGSEKLVFEGGYINAVETILPLIRKYIPKTGAVMDFGCGYGGSLVAFPKEWIQVGYDYDDIQLEYGRQFGIDLRNIEKFDGSFEKFDVIMLIQVLEHVKDPIALLKKLQSRLNDNGVLYIEVPGFASVIERGIDPRLAFKNAHRHFFCLDSLSKVGAQAGLQLLAGNERVSAVFRKASNEPSLKAGTLQKTMSAFEWLDRLDNVATSNYRNQEPLLCRLVSKLRRRSKLQKLRRMLASRRVEVESVAKRS
ncbi:MAG: hypothetical protein RL651_893 [Pseudomonadota bacterium]|jgi:SAM-dependent methyltransferase